MHVHLVFVIADTVREVPTLEECTAMPIFRIKIKEEVKRTVTAYVEASDKRAADKWASNAPIFLFRQEREESEWAEVAEIAEVDVVPDGYRSRKA